jgi:hypothetical protein
MKEDKHTSIDVEAIQRLSINMLEEQTGLA